MKKKELGEIKNKTIDDLAKKIEEKEKEIVTAMLEKKMGKIKNVHLLKSKKKDLARLATIARLKQLAQGVKNATS